MDKIQGNIVGLPSPRSDWEQTNENKADYIKNKPEIVTSLTKVATDKQIPSAKAVYEAMQNGIKPPDLSDYATSQELQLLRNEHNVNIIHLGERLDIIASQAFYNDDRISSLKNQVDAMLAPPIKDFPTTLSPNKSYNFEVVPTSMISFPSPSESKDGDYVYVTFYVGAEVPSGLAFDITHTSDIEIEFTANTGYEIFGKFNGSKWIVNYSEYTVTDGDSV